MLSGEALLIVEGKERPLRQWDFVHCPPETKHIILGAGEGPCVVLAAGAREHIDEDCNGGGYTGRGRAPTRRGGRGGDERPGPGLRPLPGLPAGALPRGLAAGGLGQGWDAGPRRPARCSAEALAERARESGLDVTVPADHVVDGTRLVAGATPCWRRPSRAG